MIQYQKFPVQVNPAKTYDFGRRGQRECRLDDIGHRDGNIWVWWTPGTFHQVRSSGHVHEAVDLMAPLGARVVAARSGRVLVNYRSGGVLRPGVGYNDVAGHYVRIETDEGTDHYSHMLAKPVVVPGQEVKAGQLLGYVGQSGNAESTCPHLHISTRDSRGRAADMTQQLYKLHQRGGWKQPIPRIGLLALGGLGALLTLVAFGSWVQTGHPVPGSFRRLLP